MSRTMRPLLFALGLASIVVMAGCEIIGPKVKVEPPKVRVPGVEIEGGGPPGRHCPPGQAKKGRC